MVLSGHSGFLMTAFCDGSVSESGERQMFLVRTGRYNSPGALRISWQEFFQTIRCVCVGSNDNRVAGTTVPATGAW